MITPNTQDNYSRLNTVWPDNNAWYEYTYTITRAFIQNELQKVPLNGSKILNAGSGGSDYGLKHEMYHLDIAPNLIDKFKYWINASIEQIPYDNDTFDIIICVGSVINYCSAMESLAELSRVLKPQGTLILEYERSQSAELWFKKEYGKSASLQQYQYLNDTHYLWLYSEKYINFLLENNDLYCIKKIRYHSLSAVVNRIVKNEQYAGSFSKFDRFLQPFSNCMAHNCIMKLQKN